MGAGWLAARSGWAALQSFKEERGPAPTTPVGMRAHVYIRLPQTQEGSCGASTRTADWGAVTGGLGPGEAAWWVVFKTVAVESMTTVVPLYLVDYPHTRAGRGC